MADVQRGNFSYLNLDNEMIAKAPIVNKKLNLKLTQVSLDRAYPDHQYDIFKINNALVYQILSKVFMDMDKYVYMKQKVEYTG